MRKKNYNVSTNLSGSADKMIDRIMVCVDDRIKKNSSRVVGAIVTKINSDGTINVKLPSEEEVEFTRIQNQTPFTLAEGDAVELFLKNGSFSNCWVFAKHGMGATQATSSVFSTFYELPIASSTELGGIKIGGGLSISSSGVLSATGGGTADSVDWSNVQSKPTTLSGYGITDARISSGTIVLGSNSIVPLTSASELNASKLIGNAPSATKATQDGDGNVITATYAKKSDIPSLNEYATQTWVQNQGYLTEHQDLSAYALKADIPTVPTVVSAFKNDAGYLTEHQSLADYATHEWVENKGYLTEHQSLAAYATEAWVGQQNYATQTWVKNQGYLTEHQSLDNYALKTDLPEVNDATLTIQKNNIEVGTFTANAKKNSVINIEVPIKASDINAVTTDAIVTTLANPSDEKIPSAKAVSEAISAAGGGDMLKSNYAPDSDDTVNKAFSDQNGKNIAFTYMPKFSLLNNKDADTLSTSQIGIIGTGNTNLPDSATGSVLFVAGDGNNAFQLTVVYATNVLYHRAYKDGVWTVWRSSEAGTSTDETADFSAYGLGFITMD